MWEERKKTDVKKKQKERQRRTRDKLARAGPKSTLEQNAQKAEREEAKGKKQKRGYKADAEG